MRYCKRLLIILFVFVSCYKQAKKEIYLLQQGYIGEVNIYFDRPDGVIVDSGDYYIYKINYNGLLMTSSSPNSGFLIDTNRLFFYSKGKLRNSQTKFIYLNSKWAGKKIYLLLHIVLIV